MSTASLVGRCRTLPLRTVPAMSRADDLERDRQVAALKEVLRSSAQRRTPGEHREAGPDDRGHHHQRDHRRIRDRDGADGEDGDSEHHRIRDRDRARADGEHRADVDDGDPADGDADRDVGDGPERDRRGDGEVESVTLDGFGDGYRPPRGAWRARLLAQRASVVVFVTVAVLAAAATAAVTWFLRPTAAVVPGAGNEVVASGAPNGPAAPVPSIAPGPASPADGPAATGPVPPSSSATAASIVVAVVGAVASPGLVTLPEGARVSDAIAAAGGALPGTDLSSINIARKVSDGEQIAVGVPAAADAGGDQGGAGGTGAAGGGSGGTAGSAKVNVNTASLAQLDTLPGVGPVIAQSIIDFREQNGPFEAVSDLGNVSGIGPATLAKLADLVTT